MLDQIVDAFGALYCMAIMGSRWRRLPWLNVIQMSTSGCILLGVLLLSYLEPHVYSRHRLKIIVGLKAAAFVSRCRLQVRLMQPPTLTLAGDLFNAVVGEVSAFAVALLPGGQTWWHRVSLVTTLPPCSLPCLQACAWRA